jgi:hypothetical protein
MRCEVGDRLLLELASQRRRDDLTSIDHPAWDRPLARIAPLDCDELLARRCEHAT